MAERKKSYLKPEVHLKCQWHLSRKRFALMEHIQDCGYGASLYSMKRF